MGDQQITSGNRWEVSRGVSSRVGLFFFTFRQQWFTVTLKISVTADPSQHIRTDMTITSNSVWKSCVIFLLLHGVIHYARKSISFRGRRILATIMCLDERSEKILSQRKVSPKMLGSSFGKGHSHAQTWFRANDVIWCKATELLLLFN